METDDVIGARRWGRAHGYYSMPGGWIYKENQEKPICQGWGKLYSLLARTIDSWLEEQDSKQRDRVIKRDGNYETRIYEVSSSRSEFGKSWIEIVCPYCQEPVIAYRWSLAGSGKKCPKCGALHTHWGSVKKIKS